MWNISMETSDMGLLIAEDEKEGRPITELGVSGLQNSSNHPNHDELVEALSSNGATTETELPNDHHDDDDDDDGPLSPQAGSVPGDAGIAVNDGEGDGNDDAGTDLNSHSNAVNVNANDAASSLFAKAKQEENRTSNTKSGKRSLLDSSLLFDPRSSLESATPARKATCTTSFPYKLFEILSRPELSHIISWKPHGRAWRVLKQKEFMEEVMPKYFSQSKFSSFIRQVNGWGFQRLTQGIDQGSYYHLNFLRDIPQSIKLMRRSNSGGSGNSRVPGPKARSVTDSEPDFYDRTKYPPPNIPNLGGLSLLNPQASAMDDSINNINSINSTITNNNNNLGLQMQMGQFGGVLSIVDSNGQPHAHPPTSTAILGTDQFHQLLNAGANPSLLEALHQQAPGLNLTHPENASKEIAALQTPSLNLNDENAPSASSIQSLLTSGLSKDHHHHQRPSSKSSKEKTIGTAGAPPPNAHAETFPNHISTFVDPSQLHYATALANTKASNHPQGIQMALAESLRKTHDAQDPKTVPNPANDLYSSLSPPSPPAEYLKTEQRDPQQHQLMGISTSNQLHNYPTGNPSSVNNFTNPQQQLQQQQLVLSQQLHNPQAAAFQNNNLLQQLQQAQSQYAQVSYQNNALAMGLAQQATAAPYPQPSAAPHDTTPQPEATTKTGSPHAAHQPQHLDKSVLQILVQQQQHIETLMSKLSTMNGPQTNAAMNGVTALPGAMGIPVSQQLQSWQQQVGVGVGVGVGVSSNPTNTIMNDSIFVNSMGHGIPAQPNNVAAPNAAGLVYSPHVQQLAAMMRNQGRSAAGNTQ